MTTITASNVIPMGDRVVVKPVERDEMTKSGIVLPDTIRERPQEGIVSAVGAGRVSEEGKRLPMDLHTGDRVLFTKYAGTEVKLNDTDHLILRESDILAKLG